MSRVVWTPHAKRDLEDIAYHIAVKDGRPQTAKRNICQLRDKCDSYGDYPLSGHALPEAEGYRFFAYKRWVVIYWPLTDGVVVEAVVDASRDFVRVFREQLGQ